jgi:hypothetical protein
MVMVLVTGHLVNSEPLRVTSFSPYVLDVDPSVSFLVQKATLSTIKIARSWKEGEKN